MLRCTDIVTVFIEIEVVLELQVTLKYLHGTPIRCGYPDSKISRIICFGVFSSVQGVVEKTWYHQKANCQQM